MEEIRRFRDPRAEATMRPGAAALFLDRDGVINADLGYVHRRDQVEWIPGIFELCRDAWARGMAPVVVTNQAGIARGLYDEAAFLAFTAWLHDEFAARGAPLLATYYCPHHPTAGRGPLLRDCACRKPKPGMLLQAGADFGIDFARSMLIGDTDSDLAAARAAGVGRAVKFDGPRLPPLRELFDTATGQGIAPA